MAITDSKSQAIQQLIDDLTEFSCESMRWCSGASEDATRQISAILEHLINEAKRVSTMSMAALEAVNAIRKKAAAPAGGNLASELVAALKKLSTEHTEAQAFVNPIIETLQFQDRISQMMDNLVRMIACWSNERERIAKGGASSLDLDRFGKALLTCTTMKEERDIVRNVIPDLPEETVADSVSMF